MDQTSVRTLFVLYTINYIRENKLERWKHHIKTITTCFSCKIYDGLTRNNERSDPSPAPLHNESPLLLCFNESKTGQMDRTKRRLRICTLKKKSKRSIERRRLTQTNMGKKRRTWEKQESKSRYCGPEGNDLEVFDPSVAMTNAHKHTILHSNLLWWHAKTFFSVLVCPSENCAS